MGEMHLFRGACIHAGGAHCVSWIWFALFCRWCRALLPHLEESAILEHFISVVLSRCPCLRGLRFFSLKWSCFGFSLDFDHLFEFLVHLYILIFFYESITMLIVNTLIKGEIEDRWMVAPYVMSDWQHGVDRLLAEYCRCRLRLDLHWCRWREGAKGLSLAEPPRSEETSRLGSMGPVAKRDQVWAAWWQEKQDEVVDRSQSRVVAHDRSLHAGLLGWATKPREKARWAETGSRHVEKLRCRGTRDRIVGLASRGRRLWRRRGCPMKSIATWPSCPNGVCIFFYVLGVAWSFSQPGETSYI
jgi:hypothetical protein